MVKLQNLLTVNKITEMKVDCEELQKDLPISNECVEISCQDKVFVNTK